MAAMGLGRPPPLGLCSSWGAFKELLESDLECSEDLEAVLGVFFSTPPTPRASEDLPVLPIVELRDSLPDSSLCKDLAGLFSFLSSLVALLVWSFFCWAASSFDCFVLGCAFWELTLILGGFSWDPWPSFRLRLESERSERAELKPEEEEVLFDWICDLLATEAALTAFCCFSLLNSFSLSSIECFCVCGAVCGLLGDGMPLWWPLFTLGGRRLKGSNNI